MPTLTIRCLFGYKIVLDIAENGRTGFTITNSKDDEEFSGRGFDDPRSAVAFARRHIRRIR
jgi:hypothetical protein